jgi:hypothetical protein
MPNWITMMFELVIGLRDAFSIKDDRIWHSFR